MRLRIVQVLFGCAVVFSACQTVSSSRETNIIGNVGIGFLTLAGHIPSALSGMFSLSPFGLTYLNNQPKPAPRPMPVQHGNGGMWRDDQDDDVDVDNSEGDDEPQNDKEFHMHNLKREDEIERLKEDDSDEIEDDDFQAILVRQLAEKLAKKNSKNGKVDHEDQQEAEEDVRGVVSSVSSMLRNLVIGLSDSDSENETHQRSLSGKPATEQKTTTKTDGNHRSNRVKRQMSLGSLSLQPFYHVRDRIRSMKRPIPTPIMAPKPIAQFDGLSQRDATPMGPIGLLSNPWSTGLSGTGGSPLGSASAGGTSPKVAGASNSRVPTSSAGNSQSGVGTKNSGSAGNSGSSNSGSSGNSGSGNKKGSGNTANKKPAQSSGEKDSDESGENSSQEQGGPESDEVVGSPGQIYDGEDSSSNEINHDEASGSEETNYDDYE